jgi:tellurite resistance protein TehA-like permease
MLAGYAGLMVLVQLRLLPVYLRLRFGVGSWSFTFSWCAAAALAIAHSQRSAKSERLHSGVPGTPKRRRSVTKVRP